MRFFVEAEPRIVFEEENRLADEALFAEFTGGLINEDKRLNGQNVGVTMNSQLKIHVEVKGKYSFPRDFVRTSKFELEFSQLIQ